MSASEKLNLPNFMMEQLRCSLCNGYLSCAPILLLPDGRSICGRCSSSTHDEPTYRQLAFESVLSETTFPCQFQDRGCVEGVLFGHVAEHEDSCPYRTFLCPSLPNRACPWEGSINQILDHFQQNHPEMVLQMVKLALKVDQDAEGVVLATIDSTAFISKFVYWADKRNLRYDIRSLGMNTNGFHYKTKLTNTVVNDFSISLKGDICLPCDPLFYDMDNAKELNIDNLLPILDNPNEITFEIVVLVTKPDRLQPEAQVVNSDDHGSCGTSQLDYGKSKNHADCKMVSQCYWTDCTFFGTPEELSQHEMTCQLRLCKCTAYNCEVEYKPETVLMHLMSHGFHYITDELDFKMVFSEAAEERIIFSLKFNGIIYINHYAKEYRDSNHQVQVRSFTYENKQTNAASLVLDIEHPKYKLKSKVYTVTPGDAFLETHFLPKCIKVEDQFTVTIKVL